MAAQDAAGLQALLDRGLPVAEVAPLLEAPPPTPSAPGMTSANPAPTTSPPAAAPPADPRTPPRERRAFGLADANVRQRFAAGAPPPAEPYAAPPPAPAPPGPQTSPAPPPTAVAATPTSDTDLGALLRELEIRPAMTGRRLLPGAAEQWTEIPITSRVYLSVRGLSAEDAPLADATARALKKLLRGT
jgi:hypothetical protein